MLKRLALILLILYPVLAVSAQDDDTPRPLAADDVAQLGVLTLLAQHNAPITEMAFSPQATAFITGSLDGTLCIWNVAGRDTLPGALLFCLPDYSPGVTSYTWSDDDTLLAVTDANGGTIHLYTVEPSHNELPEATTLPTHETPFLALNFVAGNLLAYDIFDIFTLYDVETSGILAIYEGIASDFSDDTLAILNFEGLVTLIDAESGAAMGTLATDDAIHARFSPDGRWLATWGERIQLWNVARSNRRPRTLNITADNIQFTPDGRLLATWEGENIRFWDMASLDETGIMEGHGGGVQSLTISPNSRRAISIDTTGRARLWEIEDDGGVRRLLLFNRSVDRAVISPDAQSAILTRHDFDARFYDIERAQLRGSYGISPDSVASPDWTLIATSTGSLIVWHGLRDDPRTFDWMPIGETLRGVNIRETPSTELARIGVLTAEVPIFAFGRTPESDWLQIRLPDNSVGWLFASNVRLDGDVEDLPVVELVEE